MAGKFQLAIAKQRHYLSQKISADTPTLNRLHDAGIISDYQKQNISSKVTAYDKADDLLSGLQRCPDEMFDIFCKILVDEGQQDVVDSLLENVRSRFRQSPIVSTDPKDAAVEENSHSVNRLRAETPPDKQPTDAQQTRDSSTAESSASSQQNDRVQISETCGAIDQLSLTPKTSAKNLTREFNTMTLLCSLPEDKPVLGVTMLLDELYVWHNDMDDWQDIAVYDTSTFTLRRHLPVAGLGVVNDMASCTKYQCVYIADRFNRAIRRIDKATNKHTRWRLDARPYALSVNSDYNVITTFDEVRKIMVFSTRGELVKQISLQNEDIVTPWHTVQLTADTYVVSHGSPSDPIHQICVIDGNGQLLTSFGGARGYDDQLLNTPSSLAIVKNEFIFVADLNNYRIAILTLSPLRCVQLLSIDGKPSRIWFDGKTGRLYVAVNTDWDSRSKMFTYGHIEVYNVSF